MKEKIEENIKLLNDFFEAPFTLEPCDEEENIFYDELAGRHLKRKSTQKVFNRNGKHVFSLLADFRGENYGVMIYHMDLTQKKHVYIRNLLCLNNDVNRIYFQIVFKIPVPHDGLLVHTKETEK